MNPFFRKYIISLSNRILAGHLARQKSKLTNKEPTIICNNCIAGVLLKDLGLNFNTPTINLYFTAPDYINFLERMEYYLSKEMIVSFDSKYSSEPRDYPVGKIDDIEIQFLHFSSIQEAIEKWDRRKKRIQSDNLFFIASDREDCSPEIKRRFLDLPFRNKVFFSSKKNSSKEIIYFGEYRKESQVGDLIKDGYGWYFHYDVVHWLNTGRIRKYPFITWLFRINRKLKLEIN